MKKIILGISSISTIVAPIATVISCGKNEKTIQEKIIDEKKTIDQAIDSKGEITIAKAGTVAPTTDEILEKLGITKTDGLTIEIEGTLTKGSQTTIHFTIAALNETKVDSENIKVTWTQTAKEIADAKIDVEKKAIDKAIDSKGIITIAKAGTTAPTTDEILEKLGITKIDGLTIEIEGTLTKGSQTTIYFTIVASNGTKVNSKDIKVTWTKTVEEIADAKIDVEKKAIDKAIDSKGEITIAKARTVAPTTDEILKKLGITKTSGLTIEMIGTLTKGSQTTIHFTIVALNGTQVNSKDIKVTWTKTTEEKTADAKIDVEKKAIDKAISKGKITIAKAGTVAPTTDEILEKLGITKTGGLTIEMIGTLTKDLETTIHFTIVTTHGTKVNSKDIKVTWTQTAKEIADAKIDVEKKAIDKAIDKGAITIAKAGTVAPTTDEILEKLGITKIDGLTIEIEGTLTKGSQTTIHFTIVTTHGTKVSSKDIKVTWTKTTEETADAKIDVEKKAIDKAISKGAITIAKAGTVAPTTDEILEKLGITKNGLTIEIEGTLTKGSQTTIHFTIVTTHGTKVSSKNIKVTWTKTTEEKTADAKIDVEKKAIDKAIDSKGIITIAKAGTTAPTTDEILEKLGITKIDGLTIEIEGTLTKDLETTIYFTIFTTHGTKVSSKNIKVTWTKTIEEIKVDSKKQEIDQVIDSKGEITIAKAGTTAPTTDEILSKLGITKTDGLTIEMIGTLTKDLETTIHFTIVTTHGTKVSSKDIKVTWTKTTEEKTADAKIDVEKKAIDKAIDSKGEITIAKAGTTAPTTDETLSKLGITKTDGLTIEMIGTLTKDLETTIHFTIVTTHGTKVSSKDIKVTWTQTVKEIADAKIDVEKKAIDKAISKGAITIAKAGTTAPTTDEILEKLGITKNGLTIEIEGTLTKGSQTTIHFTIVTTHGTKVSSKDIKVTWTKTTEEKTTEEKTADAKIDVEKKAIDKAISKGKITIAKAGTVAPTTDEILEKLGITKTDGLTIEIEGTLTKGSQTTIHFTIVTTHGTKVSSKNIKVTWTQTAKEIADAKIDVEKKAIDKAIDSKGEITIAKAGTTAPTTDEILEKLGITKTDGLTIEIEGTLTKGSQTTIHFTIVTTHGTKVNSKDIKVTWTKTTEEKTADAKIDVEKKAIDKAISKGKITIAKAGTVAPTTDEILEKLGITKTDGLTIEIEGTLTKGSQTTIHFTIVTTHGTKVSSKNIKVTWTQTAKEIADAKIDVEKKAIDKAIDSKSIITIAKEGTVAPTTDEILKVLGITKTDGLTIEIEGTLTKGSQTTIHFTIVTTHGTKVNSKDIKVTWTKTTEEKTADAKIDVEKKAIDKAIDSKSIITIAKAGTTAPTTDEILKVLGITKTDGLTIEIEGTLTKGSQTTIHFTIVTTHGTKVSSKNIKVTWTKTTEEKTADAKIDVEKKAIDKAIDSKGEITIAKAGTTAPTTDEILSKLGITKTDGLTIEIEGTLTKGSQTTIHFTIVTTHGTKVSSKNIKVTWTQTVKEIADAKIDVEKKAIDKAIDDFKGEITIGKGGAEVLTIDEILEKLGITKTAGLTIEMIGTLKKDSATTIHFTIITKNGTRVNSKNIKVICVRNQFTKYRINGGNEITASKHDLSSLVGENITITQIGFKTLEDGTAQVDNMPPGVIHVPEKLPYGITSLKEMFKNCQKFNQNISSWNVSKITNMAYMFQKCSYFKGGDIGGWNVSNVTNMEFMFSDCAYFNQNLGNWNVSKVTNMQNMFESCFFNFNSSLKNWNVSNVTNMAYMFAFCNIFNQDLSKWVVSKVTNMEGMFRNTQFNQTLNSWDVSKVTNMIFMFHHSKFNQSLNNWNVSNVTNMQEMFWDSQFNQDISKWNVSNVTNMKQMFGTSKFNQDISKWDVSRVKNHEDFLSGETSLEKNKTPKWK